MIYLLKTNLFIKKMLLLIYIFFQFSPDEFMRFFNLFSKPIISKLDTWIKEKKTHVVTHSASCLWF